MKLDSALCQARKLGLDVRHALVVEQNLPRLVVRRVHGDVKRRKPILEDALYVTFLHVGKRREVSVGEREPVVVVPNVEGLPQPGRQPLNEAELAFVGAAPDRWRMERDAERLTVQAFQLVNDLLAV